MTSILDQLNFIRYSKDDFLKYRDSNKFVLNEQLSIILKIINSNIKKSGGSNSPFQNSSYGHHKNNGYSNKGNYKNTDNSPSKSWRLTKTKLISENITELDKKQNEINSLLNKMSPKNFSNITGKIEEYYKENTHTDELVNSTIDNIFLKAVMQPVYCPYYVKFLKKISNEFNKIDKINTKCIEFKTIIKPKIDTPVNDNMTMSEKEKYDLFCKANKEKKYKEGYSQFIGELFNNKMINDITLEENVSFFVDNLESSTNEDAKSTYVEDLLICVCKLFITVSTTDKNRVISSYCNRVILIQNNKCLPKRLQFKIMDLHDLLKKKNIIV
jgi:hypothetical protein